MMCRFMLIVSFLASLVGCAKFKEGDCIQNIEAGYIWRITAVKVRPFTNSPYRAGLMGNRAWL